MSEFLEDPIFARGTVYPDDTDHMGHMNVAVYVRKFDEATWALWQSVGYTRKKIASLGLGLAALEGGQTYHRELFPGDSFLIRSRLSALRSKTATFHHRLYLLEDDEEILAATCTYTAACLDREAHRAVPFPQEVAEAVQAILRPMPVEKE